MKRKNSNISLFICTALAALLVQTAHSDSQPVNQKMPVGDHGAGNGGDDDGIQFKPMMRKMIASVTAQISIYPQIANIDLSAILDSTNIMVTDDPVIVIKNGVKQESVAANYKDPNRIVINRQRWTDAPSDDVRMAIGLHELVSLAGLEETGAYGVSEEFLENRGIHCNENLCSIMPTGPFNFNAAEETFQFANIPAVDQVTGVWLPIDQAQDPTLQNNLFIYGGSDPNGLPLSQKKFSFGSEYFAASRSDFYKEREDLHINKVINDLGNSSVEVSLVAANSKNDQGPYPVNLSPAGTGFSLITSMDDLSNKNASVVYVNTYSCRVLKNSNLLCSVSRRLADKVSKPNGSYAPVLNGVFESFCKVELTGPCDSVSENKVQQHLVGYVIFKKQS